MYPAKSSGSQTADAAIAARTSVLHSAILIADGTNAASIIIYDNPSAASGTVLARISIPAGGTYQLFHSMSGVEAFTGIYADVTGTGAVYIIHYSLK